MKEKEGTHMDTSYGSQGQQEPPWQGKPPQQPPWMPPPQSQPTSWQSPQDSQQPWHPPIPLTQQPPKKKKSRIGCLITSIIGILVLCAVVSNATRNVPQTRTSDAPTATSNLLSGNAPTQAVATPPVQPTPTQAAQLPTPTAIPTQAPTAQPTTPPAPTARPTQPLPTPKPTGVNGNPWGYDFNQGNLIYSPPSTFCGQYFSCVSSFWTSTNGYVAQCVNGLYTHSGGIRGACSRDGGVSRALYSH